MTVTVTFVTSILELRVENIFFFRTYVRVYACIYVYL